MMDDMSFYAKDEPMSDADPYYANIYHVVVNQLQGPTLRQIATFYDRDEANAFLRAWNGEATPGARPPDIGLD